MIPQRWSVGIYILDPDHWQGNQRVWISSSTMRGKYTRTRARKLAMVFNSERFVHAARRHAVAYQLPHQPTITEWRINDQ